MLHGLSIRDVVLIERLDLGFRGPAPKNSGGLVVLTGETGAGKSILLDALGLALGGRAESGLVRPGAAQAVVSAAFSVAPDHPAVALLGEQGLEDPGGDIVLRRVLGSDGRSRAFVNDQPVSVGLLRQLGECLVEVQGQFDQHGLLNPATHRLLLDAFGDGAALLARTAQAWRAWREAETARAQEQANREKARAEEEFLRHASAELDKLAPQIDEEKTLAGERQMLRHGAALADALDGAARELAQGRGVAGALRHAQRLLERQADKAPGKFDAAIAALDRAAAEGEEAAAQIDGLQRALDADPNRLERIEERLYELRAAARKHGATVDDLPALHRRFIEQLAALDDGGDRLAKLAKQAAAARHAYMEAAKGLSAQRHLAARKLDKAVMAELAPLKLDKAKFRTEIAALEEPHWTESGTDRVNFAAATNPGMPPGPLNKIASGGELSRFMLALKVALSGDGPVGTLVFDEVDSGVGGATAAAVGERLARLARQVQVLVVTHSPQVAARGDAHWLVGKRSTRTATMTDVRELDDQARREEIARMLAGSEITDEARAAAGKLMAARG